MSENRTVICFFRHGQTDYNMSKKVQGWEPVPLNLEGKKQVITAASALTYMPWDQIVTSDLLRAVETAQILSERYGCPYVEDKNFRERNPGVLLSHSYSECATAYPKLNMFTKVKGGEDLMAFVKRVKLGLWNMIHSLAGKNILLVSHMEVLKILCVTYGCRFENWSNAGFVVLDHESGGAIIQKQGVY